METRTDAAAPGVEAESDQFAVELGAARFRSARGLNRLRFAAVSVFLLLALALGPGMELPRWQSSLPLFVAYWLLAGAMLVASQRSDVWSRRASLGVPFVDMPIVFLLQWQGMGKVGNPESTAAFTVAPFVALVVLGALAVEARQNYIGGFMAAGLAVVLFVRSGADPALIGSTLVLLALVTLLSGYVRVRVHALVRTVAGEYVRRNHLSRYFSPEVVQAIETESLETGRRAEVTLLFSDIRGFTSISEKLDSQDVVDLLTEYHERMVDAIFAHGGTLDKFIGDGIMAWFGGLDERANGAENAVRSAIAMHESLMELNRERAERGESMLRIGVGLHTGTVILGNIGSSRRREYTAIGDAVNVASRIEGLTKTLAQPILVSDETRRAAGDAVEFTLGGEVEVRGKTEPVRVWVPVTERPIESGPEA